MIADRDKINKVIQMMINEVITPYKVSIAVGVPQSTLRNLTKGTGTVDKLSLNNAERLTKFYDEYVKE